MDTPQHSIEERRAVLALWAIPGLGPKTLAELWGRLPQGLAALLHVPVADWLYGSGLPRAVQERLLLFPSLAELAGRVEALAQAGGMAILYPGDPGFPPNLVGLLGAPPLLFFRGTVARPCRWVGMVGSRRPDAGFEKTAERFARAVAEVGVGVVSGAAVGVDQACHAACMKAGQATWAFVGSALDALDPPQARFLPALLDAGGSVYTELPPGVRASRASFPRRNRLISGASDAVLVLRASSRSGALHTALAALEQGRPILALPGEHDSPYAAGCNALIRTGQVALCAGPADVLRAVGLDPQRAWRPGPGSSAPLRTLSPEAQAAYEALTRAPRSFDEVLGECRLPSATLTSALCELELTGLAVQHPGKRYERI